MRQAKNAGATARKSKTLTYSHVTEGKTSCIGIDLWVYVANISKRALGNLQSEGHGISGFETMLSIGLGQEQQFTLILQTLQWVA